MKKMFKKVMNIDGRAEVYPLAADGVAFFITEEGTFHIYALYTKRDLSESNIITVAQNTYEDELADYKSRHGKEPAIIYLPSITAVEGLTTFIRYKTLVDNTSLEDLYNLNYRGE